MEKCLLGRYSITFHKKICLETRLFPFFGELLKRDIMSIKNYGENRR
jgi:hypothetical protein